MEISGKLGRELDYSLVQFGSSPPVYSCAKRMAVMGEEIVRVWSETKRKKCDSQNGSFVLEEMNGNRRGGPMTAFNAVTNGFFSED